MNLSRPYYRARFLHIKKGRLNMCDNCKHELEGKYNPKRFEEVITYYINENRREYVGC